MLLPARARLYPHYVTKEELIYIDTFLSKKINLLLIFSWIIKM